MKLTDRLRRGRRTPWWMTAFIGGMWVVQAILHWVRHDPFTVVETVCVAFLLALVFFVTAADDWYAQNKVQSFSLSGEQSDRVLALFEEFEEEEHNGR